MACNKGHRYSVRFRVLPYDQGGFGRHKCSGCAYDRGYRDGLRRREVININLDSLPESQAGTIRHKSPHAAYALGYLNGVRDSYTN